MKLNGQLVAIVGIAATTMIGFYGCNDILQIDNLIEEEKNINLQKKVLVNNRETVIMLYDYNKNNQSLEYQAKKVDQSTGNPVRDAVKLFIQKNNFKQHSNRFEVTDIRTTEKETIFHFSGDIKFESQSDSLLYWNALRMTVARNSNLINFSFKIDK